MKRAEGTAKKAKKPDANATYASAGRALEKALTILGGRGGGAASGIDRGIPGWPDGCPVFNTVFVSFEARCSDRSNDFVGSSEVRPPCSLCFPDSGVSVEFGK